MNPSTLKNAILFILSLIATTIATALGGWDVALQTLVGLMVADYVTGLLIAAVWKKSNKSVNGALDSRAGLKGLFRKGGILIIIYIAVRLDLLLSLSGVVRTAVIMFFIGNEGLSVIENMGIMGLPLPDIVKKSFERLKQENEVADIAADKKTEEK